MSTPTEKKNDTNGADANTINDGNNSFGHNSMSSLKGFDHRMPAGGGNESNSTFEYRGDGNSSEPPLSPNGGVGDGGEGGAKQVGIEMQFLPPDQRPGLPNDLLATVSVEPEIEDNTEAAEALRANASIRVGKMGKVARSVNAQTVRRFFKTATLRGHGPKRGKPPRVPPGFVAPAAGMGGVSRMGDDENNIMYAVHEGDYETSEHHEGLRDGENFLVDSSDSDVDDHEEELHEEEDLQDHHNDQADVIDHEHAAEAELIAKYEDTSRLFDTDATDSTKRKSKSDNYTQVMTGEDQKDIPTEVVAATMDAGKTRKWWSFQVDLMFLQEITALCSKLLSRHLVSFYNYSSYGSTRPSQHASAPAMATEKERVEKAAQQVVRQGKSY